MRPTRSASLAVFVAAVVVLTSVPGVVVAETRTGGSVVVAEGETVDGLEAFAGSVVVRGTVEGDLTGAAGDVTVAPTGRVTGDVNVVAGSIRVSGTVGGNVSGAAGDVTIAEGATVGGDLEAGAGTVRIDGTVGGDVTVGADTIVLGENATVEGDLTYDGRLGGNRDAVAGSITHDPSLGSGAVGPDVPGVGEWLFDLYGLIVNLVVGAALLLVLPGFSRRVTDRAIDSPARAGGTGLLMLLVVPIVLLLLAITVVGIPLTIAGAFLFGLLAWIGGIYGRIAVGEWLVSYTDGGNRWLAFAVGFVVVAVAVRLPLVGWLVNLLVFLLGLGALVLVGNDRRRTRRRTPADTPEDEGDTRPI